MNKLNIGLLIIVLILLVLLGFVFWKPSLLSSFNDPCYYAVYMTSGDLYFGKMSWFKPHTLSDVRMIQRQEASGSTEPTLSLISFGSNVVWGPAGDLKLNPKNILWTSKLTDESQVVKIIKGTK